MSASSSADGFGRTCVSAMKNAPLLVIISDSAAKSLAPDAITDDFPDVPEVPHIAAFDAAQHRVGFAAHHRKRGNHRRIGADRGPGDVGRRAVAAGDIDIGLHIRTVTGIVFRIDQIEILAGLDRETKALDPRFHDRRATDQDRARQLLLEHLLGCPQHPLVSSPSA